MYFSAQSLRASNDHIQVRTVTVHQIIRNTFIKLTTCCNPYARFEGAVDNSMRGPLWVLSDSDGINSEGSEVVSSSSSGTEWESATYNRPNGIKVESDDIPDNISLKDYLDSYNSELSQGVHNHFPNVISSYQNAKNRKALLAFGPDNNAIGVVFYNITQWRWEMTISVSMLYVVPEQRGKKVGHTLISNIEGLRFNLAKESKKNKVAYTLFRTTDESLEGLYKSMGANILKIHGNGVVSWSYPKRP